MKVRNTKTGAVVDVKSPVSGRNWEPLDAPAPVAEPEKKAPAKKPTKKKTT